MTKRYIGGIISANMLNVTATAASGIWSPSMAAGYIKASKWPGTLILVDYFVVGGGGGATGGIGSVNYGSGGAGGVVRTSNNFAFIPATTYTVTVGTGGAGNASAGVNGGSSIISGTGIITITATGGNGAGNSFAGASNADFNGAASGVGSYAAGGGAGAGGNASNQNGGIGISTSWTGSAVFYGGGGIGGPDGTSGSGVGGVYGSSAVTNSGGGGGGGGSGGPYGSGASGAVLFREPDTRTLATTTGSPTIILNGGYRIYKFTSSGSITF